MAASTCSSSSVFQPVVIVWMRSGPASSRLAGTAAHCAYKRHLDRARAPAGIVQQELHRRQRHQRRHRRQQQFAGIDGQRQVVPPRRALISDQPMASAPKYQRWLSIPRPRAITNAAAAAQQQQCRACHRQRHGQQRLASMEVVHLRVGSDQRRRQASGPLAATPPAAAGSPPAAGRACCRAPGPARPATSPAAGAGNSARSDRSCARPRAGAGH